MGPRPVRALAVVALVAAAAACVVVAVWSADDPPPDVVWFPGKHGGVAASPDGSELDLEVVDHMLEPEDRFWNGLTLAPTRSSFARWRERTFDAARLSTMERGWFYWRCSTNVTGSSAAYAFTGLTGAEAAELWGTETAPSRAFRDLARDRIGAERFDALAGRR